MVATHKVKPYELVDIAKNKERDIKEKVILEDCLKNVNDEKESGNRKITEAEKKEVITDNIGAHYLKLIHYVSFDDAAIYTVEVPASQHATPEVKKAKLTEVSNLMNYDVFKEVEDNGQETISGRWIDTAKENHDW